MLRADDEVIRLYKAGETEKAKELAEQLLGSGEMTVGTLGYLEQNTDLLGLRDAVKFIPHDLKCVVYLEGSYSIYDLDYLINTNLPESMKRDLYFQIFGN